MKMKRVFVLSLVSILVLVGVVSAALIPTTGGATKDISTSETVGTSGSLISSVSQSSVGTNTTPVTRSTSSPTNTGGITTMSVGTSDLNGGSTSVSNGMVTEYQDYYDIDNGVIKARVLKNGRIAYLERKDTKRKWVNWLDSLKDWEYKDVYKLTSSIEANHIYRIKINTQSLIAQNKLKPDCSDLRVTLINPSGNPSESEVPYQISGCNSQITKLHFISSQFSGDNLYIGVYYGNPSASDNQSDLDYDSSSFAYDTYDNFDDNSFDTNKWSVYNSGNHYAGDSCDYYYGRQKGTVSESNGNAIIYSFSCSGYWYTRAQTESITSKSLNIGIGQCAIVKMKATTSYSSYSYHNWYIMLGDGTVLDSGSTSADWTRYGICRSNTNYVVYKNGNYFKTVSSTNDEVKFQAYTKAWDYYRWAKTWVYLDYVAVSDIKDTSKVDNSQIYLDTNQNSIPILKTTPSSATILFKDTTDEDKWYEYVFLKNMPFILVRSSKGANLSTNLYPGGINSSITGDQLETIKNGVFYQYSLHENDNQERSTTTQGYLGIYDIHEPELMSIVWKSNKEVNINYVDTDHNERMNLTEMPTQFFIYLQSTDGTESVSFYEQVMQDLYNFYSQNYTLDTNSTEAFQTLPINFTLGGKATEGVVVPVNLPEGYRISSAASPWTDHTTTLSGNPSEMKIAIEPEHRYIQSHDFAEGSDWPILNNFHTLEQWTNFTQSGTAYKTIWKGSYNIPSNAKLEYDIFVKGEGCNASGTGIATKIGGSWTTPPGASKTEEWTRVSQSIPSGALTAADIQTTKGNSGVCRVFVKNVEIRAAGERKAEMYTFEPNTIAVSERSGSSNLVRITNFHSNNYIDFSDYEGEKTINSGDILCAKFKADEDINFNLTNGPYVSAYPDATTTGATMNLEIRLDVNNNPANAALASYSNIPVSTNKQITKQITLGVGSYTIAKGQNYWICVSGSGITLKYDTDGNNSLVKFYNGTSWTDENKDYALWIEYPGSGTIDANEITATLQSNRTIYLANSIDDMNDVSDWVATKPSVESVASITPGAINSGYAMEISWANASTGLEIGAYKDITIPKEAIEFAVWIKVPSPSKDTAYISLKGDGGSELKGIEIPFDNLTANQWTRLVINLDISKNVTRVELGVRNDANGEGSVFYDEPIFYTQTQRKGDLVKLSGNENWEWVKVSNFVEPGWKAKWWTSSDTKAQLPCLENDGGQYCLVDTLDGEREFYIHQEYNDETASQINKTGQTNITFPIQSLASDYDKLVSAEFNIQPKYLMMTRDGYRIAEWWDFDYETDGNTIALINFRNHPGEYTVKEWEPEGPKPPSAQAQITPDTIYANSNVTANWTLENKFNRTENSTWYWYVNNILVSTGHGNEGTQINLDQTLVKGDNLTFIVKPCVYDTEFNQTACGKNESVSKIVQNSIPLLDLQLEQSGTDAMCHLVVDDIDNDKINYTIKWYVNSTLVSSNNSIIQAPGSKYETLDLSQYADQIEVTCEVNYTDGEATNQKNATGTMDMSRPIANVHIYPVEIYANSQVFGNWTFNDPLSRNENASQWEWLVNSNVVSSGTGKEGDIALLNYTIKKDDNLTFRVIPCTEGGICGSSSQAGSIVRNSPPEISSVTLDYITNSPGANVTCVPDGQDLDNDSLTYEVIWYINGTHEPTYDNQTKIGGNATNRTIVKCSARAYDSENYSTWVNSSELAFTSVPTITNIIVSPSQQIYANGSSNLEISWTFIDPENGTDVSEVSWYVDNAEVKTEQTQNSTSTLGDIEVHKNQTIKAKIVAKSNRNGTIVLGSTHEIEIPIVNYPTKIQDLKLTKIHDDLVSIDFVIYDIDIGSNETSIINTIKDISAKFANGSLNCSDYASTEKREICHILEASNVSVTYEGSELQTNLEIGAGAYYLHFYGNISHDFLNGKTISASVEVSDGESSTEASQELVYQETTTTGGSGSSGGSSGGGSGGGGSSGGSGGGGGGGGSAPLQTKITIRYTEAERSESAIQSDLDNPNVKTAIRDINGTNINAKSAQARENVIFERSLEYKKDNSYKVVGTSYILTAKFAENMTDIVIIETIPKEFAKSSDNISVHANKGEISVIQNDPTYAWYIPAISSGEEASISFTVNEERMLYPTWDIIQNMPKPILIAYDKAENHTSEKNENEGTREEPTNTSKKEEEKMGPKENKKNLVSVVTNVTAEGNKTKKVKKAGISGLLALFSLENMGIAFGLLIFLTIMSIGAYYGAKRALTGREKKKQEMPRVDTTKTYGKLLTKPEPAKTPRTSPKLPPKPKPRSTATAGLEDLLD